MFDGAERAVQAGWELADIVARDVTPVRVGIHTGEVETESGNVRGLAVHVAARIMALAGAGEVLVSWTTRDLLDGSPFAFADRGVHEIKGLRESPPGLRAGASPGGVTGGVQVTSHALTSRVTPHTHAWRSIGRSSSTKKSIPVQRWRWPSIAYAPSGLDSVRVVGAPWTAGMLPRRPAW